MTKTKTNVVMRAIAFLLSLLMTFYAIPSVIYAEFSEAISSLSSDSASDSDKSTSLDVPIYEAENLREENVKTFCLPDGSYVAAVYPTAVHRQDENGVWQDIDNSLSASGSEYVSGDARVKFAKKISGNGTLFTLHENNTKITFSLIGAIKKTPGEVVKVEVEDDGTELGKKMTLANLNSTIIYRDVLDGIDVEYVLSSNDIKENIIVKEKAEEYTYSFTLKLNNLTATLTESGDVLIMNGEEVAYEIPAPVIYDANGTYADTGVGVYTLTDNGGGSYTLTVAVSSAWMNSADRAFPVTVDPTLEAKRSAFFISYVDSNNPTGAYFDPREIPIIPNQTELFVKINNLDFLPRKAYITNAEISFYSGVVWDRCMAVYRIIESWDNSITYTDKPEYSDSMLTYSTSPTYDLARSYFDITEAVKDWWASNSQNYGIVIKATESCLGNITLSGFRTDNVPSFTVSYRNLYGLENYLAYSSHSIGAGASGHVNLATGNLTLAIPTLTTTDALIGFTPTLYYNSSMLGKYNRYMHAEVPYAYHAVGVGFKWNMQQSVIQRNNSNATTETAEYYVWADGDGTEHALHIGEDEEGEDYIFDEDGLQLTYKDNGTTFTITATDGSVMTFSSTNVPAKAEDIEAAWTLTSITDKIGNKLIFEYDTKWRPTKVYVQPNGVAPIEMLEITYSGNALKEITNSITGDKVIFKNSMEYNGEITEAGYVYLREIEWVKGGEVVSELQFDYNYEGLILGVTEAVSNYSIDYGYTGKRLKTVTESAGDEVGQKIHFNYGVGYTDVRTSGSDDIYGNGDDIITRNILDNMGRCVATYAKSADNTEFLGAYGATYETSEEARNNLKEQYSTTALQTNYILNGGFDYRGTASFDHWEKSKNVSTVLSPDYDGYYAAKISAQENTTDYIYQDIFLKQGDYTLSFILQTINAKGVSLNVNVTSIAGSGLNYSKAFSANEFYSSQMDKVSASFAVSNRINGGDRVRIKISAIGAESVGSEACAIIDKITLNEGACVSGYSLICGGGFESSKISSGGIEIFGPLNLWTMVRQSCIDDEVDVNLFGNALRLNGSLKEERCGYQTVYTFDYSSGYDPAIHSNVGEKYIISGFGKAPDAVKAVGATFRLRVDVVYLAHGNFDADTESYYFDFQTGCEDWQFVSGSFTTVAKDENTVIDYICVYLEYSHQPSGTYALFDNIALISAGSDMITEYEYNKYGQVTAIKNGSYEEYYEYDFENKQLIRSANNQGEFAEYKYNENGQVVTETNYSVPCVDKKEGANSTEKASSLVNMVPESESKYTYNDYGLCEGVESYIFTDGVRSKSVVTTYTYSTEDASFGALLTETDALGTTIRHYYDDQSGRLLATLNEYTKNGYAYVYDAQGKLTGVRAAKFISESSYTTDTGEAPEKQESVTYTYDERNLLSTITTGSTVYTFYYDSFGNSTSIKAGDNVIASYEYNDYNGKLKKLTYANGLSEEYVYNSLDMLEEVWYNVGDERTLAYKYVYSSDGVLVEFHDCLTGEVTLYTYLADGKISSYVVYDNTDGTSEYTERYKYNANSQVEKIETRIKYSIADAFDVAWFYTEYTYNTDGTVNQFAVHNGRSAIYVNYTYDRFGRVTVKNNSFIQGNSDFESNVEISYKETENTTSSRVDSYTHTIGNSANENHYEYDANGNITKIIRNGVEIRYYYDNLGQLVREDNEILDRTFVYAYDNAGNILYKEECTLTPKGYAADQVISRYVYGYSSGAWGDQLTSFGIGGRDYDGPGTPITYDALGNPDKYYNGFDFDWIGRRLVGATYGNKEISFTYGDNGIRQSKTVNGVTTNYYWSGSMLIAEETDGECIVCLYDDTGAPIGFRYRKSTYAEGAWDSYFYEKNLQGDIIAVYDFAGTKLISYTYDAWGNFTTTYHSYGARTTVSNNPFTYRGYYYDTDLELYYLMSRYYDSNIGRFINADDIDCLGANGDLTSYNLYAYCSNNPVMYVDPTGHWIETVFDIISLGISVVEVCTTPTNPWAWIGLVGDAADVFIPFVGGIGETTRAVKATVEVADKLDDIYDASRAIDKFDGAIDSYKNFKKVSKGTGLEVHHIIEKRFIKSIPELGPASHMDSIILSKEAHRAFTNKWRELLPYGAKYSRSQILDAAMNIYKNHPMLQKAARQALERIF